MRQRRHGTNAWIWYALPGLAWIVIQAVRIYPPAVVMGGGHPGFNYYAYSFSHWAYSDVVALFGSRRLFLHTWPYFQNVIEYPVIIGFFMSGMALLPGFLGYFIGSVIGLISAYLLAFYLLYQARGRHALWFSLTPLLLAYGLLNWDLLGVATWGLTVRAFEKKRYRASGLWLGVGVVTKFFPIVLMPYLAMALFKEQPQGQRKNLRQFLWSVIMTGMGLNLPFAVFAERGWSEFFTFNSGRPPDPGIYGELVHLGVLNIGDVNLLSLMLTGVGGMVLLWAVWKGQIPALTAGAAALAWWFLCNKVYSPQYLLWVYYAFLWIEINRIQLIFMNLAGLLDFGMAMQWLALGTTGNPFLNRFVAIVVPPVVAMRDLILAWAAATPWWLRRAMPGCHE